MLFALAVASIAALVISAVAFAVFVIVFVGGEVVRAPHKTRQL